MKGRIAAIDCGTNTIKLLIGSLVDGHLEVLEREARMVRLGQDLDRTGVIADAALARAFEAIEDYAALIRRHGVERIRFVATSATRDAANAAVFTRGVRDRLGVEPEVVSGTEEAALAYDGALRNLRARPAVPVLVVDIGGGSTELILGDETGPRSSYSMQIGSVRLHERHLHTDPPTASEIAACVADIDAALDACPVSPASAATVVGVAGTITTISAGVLGLETYDRDAIDQGRLAVDDVQALIARVLAMTVAQRRELGWMHPGRADVIGAGGLVLSRVLARASTDELVVSESDILDGIAWSLA